ncbi:MAG: hypothetical protein K0R67_651 [Paenibacillus sp.]|jgi:hypothetical protein|nr:hypothetical protein [Paenibacillus sp.]
MNSGIMAIVTLHPEQVSGGAPIFVVASQEEQQQVAFLLEKILDGSAHDLQNGNLIIVKHH